ncbi:hypothetical protein CN135_32145 [Sinorhizobium meliloti]|uniref:hypothetical protein n=1 Tax=Rhizobium meliloti TaxID=382 RepID=UPI000FD76847|nr:hypothetical protein [Sinorhizobium meliloti]RVH50683.1 hypothetical protein CN212_10445 [Sinorhizobium meliloti]RVL70414.1 hypothetical protein CN135_32145 [Sinorhizobium meliloti]
MNNFQFTIIASGLDPEAEDFEDRFFNAGCDDATITFARGAILLEFDRRARNFAHAVASAIDSVRAAGASVERVEPDYLVSLSEIAERADLTRAAVSQYAKGDRGQGFPMPVARVTSESPLWDWVDVARWLHKRKRVDLDEVVRARFVRRCNDKIDERHKDDHRHKGLRQVA